MKKFVTKTERKRSTIDMRKILAFIGIVCLLFFSCSKKEQGKEHMISGFQDIEVDIKGDSMIYGLVCDGTTDSVIVLWPFSGDPVIYDCIDAHDSHRIIGKPSIGDWVGIIRDSIDTTVVAMAIDLDQLKGT